jgi:signal transduction histidine kinase
VRSYEEGPALARTWFPLPARVEPAGGARWPRPHRTLRGQLALTYGLIAVLSLVAAATYTTGALREVLLDLVGHHLAAQARLVADEAARSLAHGDVAAVQAYVTRIDATSRSRLLVLDAAGEPIAATVNPAPIDPRPTDPMIARALAGDESLLQGIGRDTPRERVQANVPIRGPDGSVIGMVRASFTLEQVQAMQRKLATTAAIGAAIAALAAGAVGFLLASSIGRPVREVARAASALATRGKVAPLAEPRAGSDEAVALVRAFNGLIERLNTAERARADFAADVSHDLRSLSSAMLTTVEALERGAAAGDPAIARCLISGLGGHTRRLVRMSEDLLGLARLEGGRLSVALEPVDLCDVAETIHGEWLAEATQRGVALTLAMPSVELPVHADAARLVQAVGNLVENALKYAADGARVELQARGAGARCELAVADRGPGIPGDLLPHLFDRDVRGNTGGLDGMGLGLAIASAVARAHGGELWAETGSGRGSRFVLSLPAASIPEPV